MTNPNDQKKAEFLSKCLYECIEDRNLLNLELLLKEKQADPNTEIPEEGSPFYLLLTDNLDPEFTLKASQLLLKYGANPNLRCTNLGLTLMHVAAGLNHLEVLVLLLKHGGDIFAVDDLGQFPIHYARVMNNLNIVSFLDHVMTSFKAEDFDTILKHFYRAEKRIDERNSANNSNYSTISNENFITCSEMSHDTIGNPENLNEDFNLVDFKLFQYKTSPLIHSKTGSVQVDTEIESFDIRKSNAPNLTYSRIGLFQNLSDINNTNSKNCASNSLYFSTTQSNNQKTESSMITITTQSENTKQLRTTDTIILPNFETGVYINHSSNINNLQENNSNLTFDKIIFTDDNTNVHTKNGTFNNLEEINSNLTFEKTILTDDSVGLTNCPNTNVQTILNGTFNNLQESNSNLTFDKIIEQILIEDSIVLSDCSNLELNNTTNSEKNNTNLSFNNIETILTNDPIVLSTSYSTHVLSDHQSHLNNLQENNRHFNFNKINKVRTRDAAISNKDILIDTKSHTNNFQENSTNLSCNKIEKNRKDDDIIVLSDCSTDVLTDPKINLNNLRENIPHFNVNKIHERVPADDSIIFPKYVDVLSDSKTPINNLNDQALTDNSIILSNCYKTDVLTDKINNINNIQEKNTNFKLITDSALTGDSMISSSLKADLNNIDENCRKTNKMVSQNNLIVKPNPDIIISGIEPLSVTNITNDLSECTLSPILESEISEIASPVRSDKRHSYISGMFTVGKNHLNFHLTSPKNANIDNGPVSKPILATCEEYKILDPSDGVTLIEQRYLTKPIEFPEYHGGIQSLMIDNCAAEDDYDSDALRENLTRLGYRPGPITPTTKRVYLRKLMQIWDEKQFEDIFVDGFQVPKKVFSMELAKTLRTTDWYTDFNDCIELERDIEESFKNIIKLRGGNNKTSFNYLLLDPRVTKNLPFRANTVPPMDLWPTFLNAIFYVGKGKRSRPHRHLYDAVKIYQQNKHTTDKKIQHIIDIWRDGKGVIALNIFHNTLAVEAHTREALMIQTIGLTNLKNLRAGEYYGSSMKWPRSKKSRLGVYLLYKAMQIFLNDGERQLRPGDID